MTYTIEEIKDKIRPIAEKYNVSEMYLFGSYARGEADEKSDLDFAVEIKDTRLIGAEFFEFQLELEGLFGLPVDLITLDSVYISPTRFENRFAPRFDKDKVVII